MVNDYISRNHFVVWKRTDERVGALQEPWGGYMGSRMEFDMAGDAGVVKYAGMAAMALKFELLKNTINIDKFPNKYESKTIFIILYISIIYKIYMK